MGSKNFMVTSEDDHIFLVWKKNQDFPTCKEDNQNEPRFPTTRETN